jgi:hypothetical protein
MMMIYNWCSGGEHEIEKSQSSAWGADVLE